MMNLTDSKKKELRKYAVYAGMGILCLVAFWVIFGLSSGKEEQQPGVSGFNTEVPAPAKKEMASDKQKAYEQEIVQQKQQERMKTLYDFTDEIFPEENPGKGDDMSLIPGKEQKTSQVKAGTRHPSSSTYTARNSVDAHKDMNRTMESFYESPKQDTEEVKQLKAEVESLKNRLDNQPQRTGMEEQMALLEKSYEMASRYMPQGQTGMPAPSKEFSGEDVQDDVAPAKVKNGKTQVFPVTNVHKQIVSALYQPLPDTVFLAAYSKPRNMGFYTVETGSNVQDKNTIRACIHDDQTVSDGMEPQRNLRIRLQEPMTAGGKMIPAHTILTGQARIGERLEVVITSVEYQGHIYGVDIIVYDVDGQRGISIPPSLEANAAKEIAANSGSNMGTSFTFSQSAGQQIAADLGRGVIQGTSQYVAKKMRVVKVHLKAGHQVLLLPADNM